jgi:hypothetical protein
MAAPNVCPVGSLPSVSTVKEMATGMPPFWAARDPHGLLDVVHRDRAHHVRTGVGEGVDLRPVVFGRVVRRHRAVGHVPVAAGTHAPTEDDRDTTRLVGVPDGLQEREGTPVDVVQHLGRVAQRAPHSAFARQVGLSRIRPTPNRAASSA